MTSVLALRHVRFEDLGTLDDVFRARGWSTRYLEAGLTDWTALDPLGDDLVVVLGGPIGVYDDAAYPFITRELAFLEKRLAARKPTLGLCLGAQMMAKALGARVYPGPAKEIGWSPLLLTGAGQMSPARHLAPEKTFMFHWHGDVFDLPDDAVNLAFTQDCPHQAFVWNDTALAFQCHPEVRGHDLEQWFIGHAVEIATTRGVNVAVLRADTARYAATLERQGILCFDAWLDSLPMGRER